MQCSHAKYLLDCKCAVGRLSVKYCSAERVQFLLKIFDRNLLENIENLGNLKYCKQDFEEEIVLEDLFKTRAENTNMDMVRP